MSDRTRTLHIHLLGTPQAFIGDEPLPLPSPPKAFLLWAYLLLKRAQPVPREQLAYLLWPDVPEPEARANLRRHLHLLRKQLPPGGDWIPAARGTLQWNPAADCQLDVAVLESFDAETAGDEEWAVLDGLYRGDLLEGFYDDWVLTERARLRRRYIRLLERRIALQKARGDLRGAIHTTQRLLACDPLREEPYRYLMELYYRAGDRAAALREFARCADMLRTELDAAPMPETLALRDAIRAGVPLAPLPAPSPPPPPPTPAMPSPAPRPRPRPAWGTAAVALLLLALAVLLVVGLLRPGAALRPITVSIAGPDSVQDTWITEESPTLPYDPQDDTHTLKADYPQVHLTFFGYPYDRVLIRFDLSQIPPSAKVRQAVFYLHLADYINEDLPEPLPATVAVYRVLRPWQAETATFNSPWSQPGLAAGVDYDDRPLATHSFHGATWVTADITDLAQAWLASPSDNYGLLLMLVEAPQGAHYWVDTSDYPLPSRRPRLDLTYTR